MIRLGRLAIFVAAWFLGTPGAKAQVVYQNETLPPATGSYQIFNNSEGTETEDNWVANSFVVKAGGTRLQSISVFLGATLTNQSVTVTIYNGSSLTNPQAGTGLSRILASTNTVSLSGAAGTLQTILLGSPVTLSVGQDFYAAVLMPGVLGTVFPFSSDGDETPPVTPLGQSFFDVGPSQGAAYNLDMTANATVLGGNHPVVGMAQAAGNAGIRVNAVPEPGSMVLTLLGVVGLCSRRSRKQISVAAQSPGTGSMPGLPVSGQ
jgi:hypothetical protein